MRHSDHLNRPSIARSSDVTGGVFSGFFEEVSLPCGRLELDQIASFAGGFHRVSAAILDGRRPDAGGG